MPAGSTFDVNTLLFTWTPGFEQFGTFQVTFTATKESSNGTPLSVTQTVTIAVLPVDRPPLLTPIVDQSVPGGAALDVPVGATDPDAGDKITLTVTGLPSFGTFTDNGDGTGSFPISSRRALADKGNYRRIICLGYR